MATGEDKRSCTMDVEAGSFVAQTASNMGRAMILVSVHRGTLLIGSSTEVNLVENAMNPTHDSWLGNLSELNTPALMSTVACQKIFQQIAAIEDLPEKARDELMSFAFAEVRNAVDYVVRHEHTFLFMMLKVKLKLFKPYVPPMPPLLCNEEVLVPANQATASVLASADQVPTADRAEEQEAKEQLGSNTNASIRIADGGSGQEENAEEPNQFYTAAFDDHHNRSDYYNYDDDFDVEEESSEEGEDDEYEELLLEAEGEFEIDDDEDPLEQQRKGLSRADLEFYRVLTCFEGEEPAACTICMEKIPTGKMVVQLPCYHVFHDDCIKPWLQRRTNCPNCRVELAKIDDDSYSDDIDEEGERVAIAARNYNVPASAHNENN